MSTPVFELPVPTAPELAKRLEDELQRQHEQTPEPTFRYPTPVQSYKWLCQTEHSKFKQREVEVFRMNIPDPSYWECEARHLKELLSETTWQNLVRKNSSGHGRKEWHGIALAYRRLLRRRGVTKQQVLDDRLLIKDQEYWKPEAQCLRNISTNREQEWEKRRRAKPRKQDLRKRRSRNTTLQGIRRSKRLSQMRARE